MSLTKLAHVENNNTLVNVLADHSKGRPSMKLSPDSLPSEVYEVITSIFNPASIVDVQVVPKNEFEQGKAWHLVGARTKLSLKIYRANHTTNFWCWVAHSKIKNYNDWAYGKKG